MQKLQKCIHMIAHIVSFVKSGYLYFSDKNWWSYTRFCEVGSLLPMLFNGRAKQLSSTATRGAARASRTHECTRVGDLCQFIQSLLWTISQDYFTGLFHWTFSLNCFIGLCHWTVKMDRECFIGLFHWIFHLLNSWTIDCFIGLLLNCVI